jgi:hypothetical protein
MPGYYRRGPGIFVGVGPLGLIFLLPILFLVACGFCIMFVLWAAVGLTVGAINLVRDFQEHRGEPFIDPPREPLSQEEKGAQLRRAARRQVARSQGHVAEPPPWASPQNTSQARYSDRR